MAGVTTALVVAGLLNFGSNTYFIREISSKRMPWDIALARFVGRAGYSVLVGVALGLTFHFAFGLTDFWVGGGVAALTISSNLARLSQVVPLARRSLYVAGIGLMVEKAVPLAIVGCLFLTVGISAVYIPAVIASGCLATVLYNWVFFSRLYRAKFALRLRDYVVSSLSTRARNSKSEFRNPWRGSLGIGVASIFYSIRQLDVLVVRLTAGAPEAGEYAAVSRWIQPVAVIAASLGNAILPEISSATSLKSAMRELSRYRFVLGIICLGAIAGCLFSKELTVLVLGSEYAGAWPALVFLFLGMPIAFSRQLLYIVLVARQLERACSWLVVAMSTVGLLGGAVLSYYLGSMGVGLAFTRTELSMLVGFLYIAGAAIRTETIK